MSTQANTLSPSTNVPETPYPPCYFTSTEEKKLYHRLREIWLQHSDTWDDESRAAWPGLLEQASLSPTTTKKVVSHMISKKLTGKNVTWAHVVVLRVIFKTMLFRSKKILKLIKSKYPRANFNTYAYSEKYKTPLSATAVRHDIKPARTILLDGLDGLDGDDCGRTAQRTEFNLQLESPQNTAAVSPFFKEPSQSPNCVKDEPRELRYNATIRNIPTSPKRSLSQERKECDQQAAKDTGGKIPEAHMDGPPRSKSSKMTTSFWPSDSLEGKASESTSEGGRKRGSRGSSEEDEGNQESDRHPVMALTPKHLLQQQQRRRAHFGIENRLGNIIEQLNGHDARVRDLQSQLDAHKREVESLKREFNELKGHLRPPTTPEIEMWG